MNLIDHLKNKSETPRITRVEVKASGGVFIIEGYPDATFLSASLLMAPDKAKADAAHYSGLASIVQKANNQPVRPVDEMLARNINLVAACLVREDEDPSKPNRYDVSDIVNLVVLDGPLFMELLKAAITVTGYGEDAEDAKNELLAGNSSA